MKEKDKQIEEGKRLCIKCKRIKEKTDFYPLYGTKYIHSWCKRCFNDFMVKRATYTEKTKNKNRKATRKYLNSSFNKIKIEARKKYQKALRAGELIRPSSCSVSSCLNTKIEGHHPDYRKPLEVVWLCNKHHRELERKCL